MGLWLALTVPTPAPHTVGDIKIQRDFELAVSLATVGGQVVYTYANVAADPSNSGSLENTLMQQTFARGRRLVESISVQLTSHAR